MKRNYKLYDSEAIYDDVIDNLLHSRGIKDVASYKNAGRSELIEQPLANMDTAYKILEFYRNIMSVGNKINVGIVVDCDCDGFCSASMLYSFLVKDLNFPDVHYFLHNGKKHGLEEDIMKQIKEKEIDLLFIPDAGTNDIEQLDELAQTTNMSIIILDHHVIEPQAIEFYNSLSPTQVCLVNVFNTYENLFKVKKVDEYPNKELSGGAVTWKFIEYVMGYYQHIEKDYSDLAMLSLIGDNMDLREIENRAIINLGLNNINNLMLCELISSQSYSIGDTLNLKPEHMSFYIVPLINAVIRIGALEEKELLFRGLCELDTGLEYDCRKKNKDTGKFEIVSEGFYPHVARMCHNVKGKQKRIIDNDFDYCVENIEFLGLDKNEIIVFNTRNKINNNLTGLAAMKVADYFNKPTLIIHAETDEKKIKDTILKFGEKEVLYSGSMRNVAYGLENLQETLLSTECFEYVSGHENAAGVSIRRSKVKEMIDKINIIIREGNHVADCYIDDVLDFEDIDTGLIHELVKFKQYIGVGIPDAKLLVKNIRVNVDDVEIIGKLNDTFKVQIGDITIIQFKATDLITELGCMFDNMVMDIVCKASINLYQGKSSCQLIIEDYEITVEE